MVVAYTFRVGVVVVEVAVASVIVAVAFVAAVEVVAEGAVEAATEQHWDSQYSGPG